MFPWVQFRSTTSAFKMHTKDYPNHLRHVRFHDPTPARALSLSPINSPCPRLRSALSTRAAGRLNSSSIRSNSTCASRPSAEPAKTRKSELWIAISVYRLVAIVKKRLELPGSHCTLLQVFSIAPFEKMPLSQALRQKDHTTLQITGCNKMILFEFYPEGRDPVC
jgi:hypothetical protein